MTDIKTKLSTAMWRDLKTDDERATWLLLGRGFETGVVCKSIQNELAMAYSRLIEYQKAASEIGERMILNAQGCAECGKGSGYALFCVACHDEFRVWEGLTDEDIEELRCHGAHSVSDTDFRAIETRLKEKNT